MYMYFKNEVGNDGVEYSKELKEKNRDRKHV